MPGRRHQRSATAGRASVGRLLESGLAVDANRLSVFLSAPVEGIVLARALLRGVHGDRVPGLQRFLRGTAAVAVAVHVLRFVAGGARQYRVTLLTRVPDQPLAKHDSKL